MCNEYNGWENYNTWVSYTWLTSEENSYRYWDSLAWELLHTETSRDRARIVLAAKLEQSLMNDVTLENGLLRDLLTNAIHTIDYYELAEGLLPEEESND